jgi:hypothetical protein
MILSLAVYYLDIEMARVKNISPAAWAQAGHAGENYHGENRSDFAFR